MRWYTRITNDILGLEYLRSSVVFSKIIKFYFIIHDRSAVIILEDPILVAKFPNNNFISVTAEHLNRSRNR